MSPDEIRTAEHGQSAIPTRSRAPLVHEDAVAAMKVRAAAAYRTSIRFNRTAVAVGRALLIVFILGFWAYAAQSWSDPQSISDPVSVLAALVDLVKTGRLWPQLGQTLLEVFVGYAAGAVAAMLLAFAFASAPSAERVLRPCLLAVYSIPKIALAPLVVMWFGLGIAPKVILAATFVFFIVFMNAVAGIESVKRQQIDILRVMGAGRRALLLKLVLPTMMPFLLLGLRLSIPEAMTGAVIGEFISASQGLGYVVYSASNELNMAVSIAAIIVLVLVVGIADALLGALERRLPWQTVMNANTARGRV
jgi:NitT/TauT family transport system permease protein